MYANHSEECPVPSRHSVRISYYCGVFVFFASSFPPSFFGYYLHGQRGHGNMLLLNNTGHRATWGQRLVSCIFPPVGPQPGGELGQETLYIRRFLVRIYYVPGPVPSALFTIPCLIPWRSYEVWTSPPFYHWTSEVWEVKELVQRHGAKVKKNQNPGLLTPGALVPNLLVRRPSRTFHWEVLKDKIQHPGFTFEERGFIDFSQGHPATVGGRTRTESWYIACLMLDISGGNEAIFNSC